MTGNQFIGELTHHRAETRAPPSQEPRNQTVKAARTTRLTELEQTLWEGKATQHCAETKIWHVGHAKLSCILDSCTISASYEATRHKKTLLLMPALHKVPAPRQKNLMHKCHCQLMKKGHQDQLHEH